jgi:hypothetical protein
VAQKTASALLQGESTFYSPTLWVHANYTEPWRKDAENELTNQDRDGRRREIIFSLAYFESFLYEWVRTDILNGNVNELEQYFPTSINPPERVPWYDQLVLCVFGSKGVAGYVPNQKNLSTKQLPRSIFGRIKVILGRLKDNGKIKGTPDYGNNNLSGWSDFRTLVGYRNGLIHAGASRPDTANLQPSSKPSPKPDELDKMQAGEAINCTKKLVSHIISQAGPTFKQKHWY